MVSGLPQSNRGAHVGILFIEGLVFLAISAVRVPGGGRGRKLSGYFG